jgi:hypothetical protein
LSKGVEERLHITEIERALHSIVEAANYLEQLGDASIDQVVQRLEDRVYDANYLNSIAATTLMIRVAA